MNFEERRRKREGGDEVKGAVNRAMGGCVSVRKSKGSGCGHRLASIPSGQAATKDARQNPDKSHKLRGSIGRAAHGWPTASPNTRDSPSFIAPLTSAHVWPPPTDPGPSFYLIRQGHLISFAVQVPCREPGRTLPGFCCRAFRSSY